MVQWVISSTLAALTFGGNFFFYFLFIYFFSKSSLVLARCVRNPNFGAFLSPFFDTRRKYLPMKINARVKLSHREREREREEERDGRRVRRVKRWVKEIYTGTAAAAALFPSPFFLPLFIIAGRSCASMLELARAAPYLLILLVWELQRQQRESESAAKFQR